MNTISVVALTLVMIALPTAASAATYYVSPTGNDAHDGSSPNPGGGVVGPWATVNAAQAHVVPGDTVIFSSGHYYAWRWAITTSGRSGLPITYRAADGARVVIDGGRMAPSAWVTVSEGVYSGTITGGSDHVMYDDQPLVRVASRTALVAGQFWTDETTMVIQPMSAKEPAAADIVIVTNFDDALHSTSLRIEADHIVLDGLVVQGGYSGIWAAGSGPNAMRTDLVVRNCEARYTLQYAIRLDNWSGCLINGSQIYGAGQVNWPRGINNWPHAIIGYEAHDVTVRSSKVHDNHGEGVGPFLGCTNWKILSNEVYDNWSVNIYIDTDEGDMSVDGNLVYNTGRYPVSDIRNSPDGIRVANEYADSDWYPDWKPGQTHDASPAVANVTITNNIVLNCGGGIRAFRYSPLQRFSLDHATISNNTVVGTVGGLDGLMIDTCTNTMVTNNLSVGSSLNVYSSGQTVSNNLAGAIDPHFTGGSGWTSDAYRLKADSIAVNTGTTLGAPATDFTGNNRLSGPAVDIGAFEFIPTVVPGSGTGLAAAYFADSNLSGAALGRTDATIDFDWGNGAPANGVAADSFSVRWAGQVQTQFSETYTFTTLSDDGVRLWVNGQQLINNWTDHGPMENSGTITLVAGQKYDVKMEYYENAGGAVAKLSWASPSTAKQIIPTTQLFPSTPGALPAGWTAQDIGGVALGGSTTISNGTWTVSGSGADIWNNADGCRFASQRVTGDVQITAQVSGLTTTDGWAKAGVMIRESLTAGSRHASTFATAANGLAYQRRLVTDGVSSHTAGPGNAAPYWVRIERLGNVVISSTSPNGTTWTDIRRETITMSAAIYVGLAVTSHNNGALCTGTFTNVQVVGVAAAAN